MTRELPSLGMTGTENLFFDWNAEGLHFAVEMRALQAKDFGGAADVAMVLVEGLEDVIAFVGSAGLVESREAVAVALARPFAIDQRRQVLAVELGHRRIHDDNALDHIA